MTDQAIKPTDEYVPTGYVPQFELTNFELNRKAAGFRKKVVQAAESKKVSIKLKNDRNIRVAVSDEPSKRMRGAARSVFGEALRLYQFAPPGVRPVDWTIEQLTSIFVEMPVVVVEWLENGEQKSRTGLLKPEEFAGMVPALRYLLVSTEKELSAQKVNERAAAFQAALAR